MKKDYQDWKEAINRELGSLIDYELNSMDMGMLNIELNWEEYGLPKANENKDYNLPRYIKGSGRKPSSRARRIQQTENRKKRNIRIAKAKGYDLDKCSRPEKAGTKNVLSNIYNKHWKDWYPDSPEIEQQKKLAQREIKDYPNDILTFEDEYLYPLKRNYFDKGDYYLCTDNIHAHMNKSFGARCSTSVKEVLFSCLLQ